MVRLPGRLEALRESAVAVWHDAVAIPTYPDLAANCHRMFLEKRVYQGSSRRVYRNPGTDQVSDHAVERAGAAVHVENEYVRLMVLPGIGGRIHVGMDWTNGYDFLYRKDVIKPILGGLAEPWISGGVEVNWPQHHRPSTFMAVGAAVEELADGGRENSTVADGPVTPQVTRRRT